MVRVGRPPRNLDPKRAAHLDSALDVSVEPVERDPVLEVLQLDRRADVGRRRAARVCKVLSSRRRGSAWRVSHGGNGTHSSSSTPTWASRKSSSGLLVVKTGQLMRLSGWARPFEARSSWRSELSGDQSEPVVALSMLHIWRQVSQRGRRMGAGEERERDARGRGP